jgi:hypothetical protein
LAHRFPLKRRKKKTKGNAASFMGSLCLLFGYRGPSKIKAELQAPLYVHSKNNDEAGQSPAVRQAKK